MTAAAHQTRLDQILDRLETRSKQCPGMFPVSSQAQWRQLAMRHQSDSNPSLEDLWRTLESFDRDPELAHQILNRLLADTAPVSLTTVDADPKQTAQSRRNAIEALLNAPDSACQKPMKKTA